MSNPTTTAATAEPAGRTLFDLVVLPVLQWMGSFLAGLWDALVQVCAWEIGLVLGSPVAAVTVLAIGFSLWADNRRDVLTAALAYREANR